MKKDNQTKLLQKIEELTLYMIELKKENEARQKENEMLREASEALKQRLTRLEGK